MPYGMLAGALSKAISESLGGATEGLLGAEDIRRKRAAEALQQQRLGIEQGRFGLEAQMAPIQRQYYQSLIQRHHQPHLFQYGPNVGAVDPRTQQFRALGQFPQSPQQLQESQLRQYEINAAQRAEEQWPMWQREFRALASDPNVPPSIQRLMNVAATDPAVGKALAVEYIRGAMRQLSGGDLFKTTTPGVRQELIHGMGLTDPSKWGANYETAQKRIQDRATEAKTRQLLAAMATKSPSEKTLDDADLGVTRLKGYFDTMEKIADKIEKAEGGQRGRFTNLPLRTYYEYSQDREIGQALVQLGTLQGELGKIVKGLEQMGARVSNFEMRQVQTLVPDWTDTVQTMRTKIAAGRAAVARSERALGVERRREAQRRRDALNLVGPGLGQYAPSGPPAPATEDEDGEGFTGR